MSHSYSQNLLHCVFSTYERRNLIPLELQPRLWGYMNATAKKEGVHVITAGGIANHAHIALALPPTVALSTALQKIKANSSRWLGEQGINFDWQQGYGAFSVNASQLNKVVRYINNQPQHHKRLTFEDEFLSLLKKSGIPYDPKYVFG